jgi:hypothetical protein
MRQRWSIEWWVEEVTTRRQLYYAMDSLPGLTLAEAWEYANDHANVLTERARLDWPQAKTALRWAALGKGKENARVYVTKLLN